MEHQSQRTVKSTINLDVAFQRLVHVLVAPARKRASKRTRPLGGSKAPKSTGDHRLDHYVCDLQARLRNVVEKGGLRDVPGTGRGRVGETVSERVRCANGFIRALDLGFVSLGAHRITFATLSRRDAIHSLVRTQARNKALVVLRVVEELVVRILRNPFPVLKEVKAELSLLRAYAFGMEKNPGIFGRMLDRIGRRDPTSYLQLSMIGRALPYPAYLQTREEDVLADHAELLANPFDTDPADLEEARRFGKAWARRFRLQWSAVGDHGLIISPSACVERTRGEGGQRSFWAAAAAPLLKGGAGGVSAERTSNLFGSAQSRPACKALAEAALNDALMNLARTDGAPTGVVHLLSEYGHKFRTVTKHSATWVASLHPLRLDLQRALLRDARLRVLEGGAEAIRPAIEEMVAPEGAVLVSADLRDATDRLPMDIQISLVSGLLDFAPLDEDRRALLLSAFGPMILRYSNVVRLPDGTMGPLTIKSRRGQLMGNPVSWVLLNIAHSFVLDLVDRETKHLSRPSLPSDRCLLMGDDLVGLWLPEEEEAYQRVWNRLGGQMSPGKHLVSANLGIFTETIFDRKVVAKRDVQFRLKRVTPSRPETVYTYKERVAGDSLTSYLLPSTVRPAPLVEEETIHVRTDVRSRVRFSRCFPLKWAVKTNSTEAGAEIPRWLAQVNAVAAIKRRPRIAFRAVDEVWRAVSAREIRELSAFIPPTLSFELGGLGLGQPSQTLSRVPRRWRHLLRAMLYRGGVNARGQSFGSIWSMLVASKVYGDEIERCERLAPMLYSRSVRPFKARTVRRWARNGITVEEGLAQKGLVSLGSLELLTRVAAAQAASYLESATTPPLHDLVQERGTTNSRRKKRVKPALRTTIGLVRKRVDQLIKRNPTKDPLARGASQPRLIRQLARLRQDSSYQIGVKPGPQDTAVLSMVAKMRLRRMTTTLAAVTSDPPWGEAEELVEAQGQQYAVFRREYSVMPYFYRRDGVLLGTSLGDFEGCDTFRHSTAWTTSGAHFRTVVEEWMDDSALLFSRVHGPPGLGEVIVDGRTYRSWNLFRDG